MRKAELEAFLGEPVQLIVVDDGSAAPWEFDALAGEARVIHLSKNKGKGAALREGFRASETALTLFTDADFPYRFESIRAIIEALRNGADVALGHRLHDYYASVPWFRKGLSEAFRWVLKDVLRFPTTDTQCGLKGMNLRGREVFLQTAIDRFLVDMEFIQLVSRRKDLRVEPVVVHLREYVEFSTMGASVLLREMVNFLRILFLR